MAKNKKKKIKSHVKLVKMQQKKNPVSQAKYKKKLRIARRKDFFRRFWKTVVVIVIVLAGLFFAGNAMLYKKTGDTLFSCARDAKDLVAASSADDFKLAQTSYIYSDDGTKIAELSEDEDATYLTYEGIPSNIVNAFVAVEDRTFWTNSGVDYKGILRVCLNYVRTRGEVAEGASTITQQLARGTYLSNEKTIIRKIKEIFIARELTKTYTKEQIMEFYCNTCCFANGIYGIEDAAQTYFGKSASELTLSESAYICAIPNRPEYYNPLKQPENALTRRDKILDDMEECGFIESTACEEAKTQTITVTEIEEETSFYNYETTYAIYCAVRYFMKLDGFEFQYVFESDEEYSQYSESYDEAYAQAKHKLYTGGYEVYTSINLTAQEKLQEVLDDALAFSETTREDGTYALQGALTVIDNRSGKVIGIIGGRSQENNQNVYSLNRAYQGYAQPGSSIKPLVVYTPALEEGFDASSNLYEIDVKTAKKKTVSEIAEMTGSSYTLRSAVEQSKNGCAYWLFAQITPKVGLSYITEMGFSRIKAGDYTMSAALGGLSTGTTTVEMANAYSTLENHGEYTQTDCIESICDSNGDEVYANPEMKKVYSTEAADAMTDILTGVLKRGTARKANWYGVSDIDAAGKTGTTDDGVAAWFCGYTPYYSIAVWVGNDEWKNVDGMELSGSSYPLTIWKEAMLYMTEGCDAAEFDLEGSYVSSETTETLPEETTEEAPVEETDPNAADTVTDPAAEQQTTTDVNGNTGDDSTISGTVPSTSTGTDTTGAGTGSTGTETNSTGTGATDSTGGTTGTGTDGGTTSTGTDGGTTGTGTDGSTTGTGTDGSTTGTGTDGSTTGTGTDAGSTGTEATGTDGGVTGVDGAAVDAANGVVDTPVTGEAAQ